MAVLSAAFCKFRNDVCIGRITEYIKRPPGHKGLLPLPGGFIYFYFLRYVVKRVLSSPPSVPSAN